jgi:hypothetical protein
MSEVLRYIVVALIVSGLWYLAVKSVLSTKKSSFFFTLHEGSRTNRFIIISLITMTLVFIGVFFATLDFGVIREWANYFLYGGGGGGAMMVGRKFSPDQKIFAKAKADSIIGEEKVEAEKPSKQSETRQETIKRFLTTYTEDDKEKVERNRFLSGCSEEEIAAVADTLVIHERFIKMNDRCISRVSISGSQQKNPWLFTLEDKEIYHVDENQDFNSDNKEFGESAIPKGVYPLRKQGVTPMTKRWRSKSALQDWFKNFIHIANVPFYSSIYYHAGNKPEDSLGCPLTGLGTQDTSEGKIVVDSVKAMKIFYDRIMPDIEEGKIVAVIVR